MWHPYSRKQSGCLALRTNGTTPLGSAAPAPRPADARARARPCSREARADARARRRRTASAARGSFRARHVREAKSQRPPCVASCRTRITAAQAGGAARGARDHIKAASGMTCRRGPRFPLVFHGGGAHSPSSFAQCVATSMASSWVAFPADVAAIVFRQNSRVPLTSPRVHGRCPDAFLFSKRARAAAYYRCYGNQNALAACKTLGSFCSGSHP